MKTITRADLAEAIYSQVGLSRNESAMLLETVLERMSATLEAGEGEEGRAHAPQPRRGGWPDKGLAYPCALKRRAPPPAAWLAGLPAGRIRGVVPKARLRRDGLLRRPQVTQ